MNKEEVFETKERVAVIGTGNYGIAIGKRLLDYGYNVVFGSRTPNKKYLEECLQTQFEVAKISEAFYKSDKFVFLAISAKNYEHFVKEINLNENETSLNDSNVVVDLKKSKIIIELSNLSDEKNEQISNAERLENLIKYNTVTKNDNLLSNIHVVKGFNLVNAYTMSTNFSETKGNTEIIPIAGNDKVSKEEAIRLANRIGFQGIDVGPLKNSLELELSNIKTFNEWHYPIILTALFVLFNLIWVFIWYFFFPKKPHTFKEFIVKFSPLEHLNKVLGFSSLQILAFVYLASIVAGIYQLKNGTKYKRFPKYLDNWLKTRKQFGLLSFLLATVHAIASLITLGPNYLDTWYRTTDVNKFNLTKLSLNGEINMITGFCGYIILSLVALSSVNSIASSLNWSEWRFVQTKLGLSALVIGNLHAISMYINIYLDKDKYNYSTTYLLTRVKLISIYFPAIVIILRFIFAYLPSIKNRLNKIRDGSLIIKVV